jgi:hypothetical protein
VCPSCHPAALGEALFRLADAATPIAEIERALPRVRAEAMPYSDNLMCPIMNMMPSPRDALVAVLARIRGEWRTPLPVRWVDAWAIP